MKEKEKEILEEYEEEEEEEEDLSSLFPVKNFEDVTTEDYNKMLSELNTLRFRTAGRHFMTTNLRTAKRSDLVIVVLPHEERFIAQRVRKVTPTMLQTKDLVIPLNKIMTIEDFPRFRLPFTPRSKRIHLAIMENVGLVISGEIKKIYKAEFIRELAYIKDKKLSDNWIIKMFVYAVVFGLVALLVLNAVFKDKIWQIIGDFTLVPPTPTG